VPHGLSGEEFDELVERYDVVFSDLLEFEGTPEAETAIADAADAIQDGGGDPYHVLTNLLDEREAAAEAYGAGMDVDWDISDYEDFDLGEEWFFYH